MTPAQQLVARYKTAGFIPDKFWKRKRDELKHVLQTPLDTPFDVVWAIRDKLIPFYTLFADELKRYGLNRHAESTLDMRIDTIKTVLEKISEGYASLEKEVTSTPYPATRAVDEVSNHIEYQLKEQFKASLPTLGKAIKVVWSAAPGSVMALAERMVKKATPEETAALVALAGGDLSTPFIDAKYKFVRRVGLEAQAKKLIKKEKVERDYFEWFDFLREVLLTNYGEEAIQNTRAFDEFSVGDLKVILLDPNINAHESSYYAKAFIQAREALRAKGFAKLWYGVFFVTSREFKKLSPEDLAAYKELGYETLESQAGTYHSGEDIVKITAPPTGLPRTIIHEMGHRYWYKFMRPGQRARFNDLVKTNPSKKVRDYPSGPTDEEGLEKTVVPVSTYGKSTIEEAFAEVFEHYVDERDIDRDQLESFRSVLKTARLLHRYKQALVKTVDLDLIEGLRKDFLTLMKNIPRVTDYKTGAKLRDAFIVYKNNFDEFFFERFLNAYKENEDHRFDGLRKPAWDFYIELSMPLGYPDEYYSEAMRFGNYQHEVKTWEPRLRTKAQKFWKATKEALSYQTSPVEVKIPDRDRLVLEGFQIEIVDYDPTSSWQTEAIPKLKEALQRYRRNAAKTVPWLLKHQLPLEANFNAKLDEGGRYHGRYISISLLNVVTGTPDNTVKTLAHEMGHHMFKHLSKDASTFWHTAIRQDYGPLPLLDVLSAWPASMRWTSDFVEMMASKDPVLALQVDVTSWGHGGRSEWHEREDFQAAYDRGELTIPVPQSPVTGYAGKNPEEAFCEAIGLLVAYGPQAVLPIVRHWLDITVPGDVKTAAGRIVGKFLLGQGRYDARETARPAV